MARRQFSVFSLSFLDVMACGLGATVLFFMIISAQVRQRVEKASSELLAQSSRVEEEVLDGRKNLVRLRDTLEEASRSASSADSEIARLAQLLAELQKDAPEPADSTARTESVEQLRADVRRLEEAKQRLAAAQPEPKTGKRVRSFVGDGNRQYLTGMKMGGDRVLILIDTSASMLARTYINVVRYRAMPDTRKRQAPKWRQAIATVDWLTAQLPPGGRFQVYAFDETARSVVTGTDGNWLDVGNGEASDRAVAALRQLVPGRGTSLHRAFDAIRALNPQPDNVYLITDGLPTQGDRRPPDAEQVKPEQRVKYFSQAARELSGRIPVNILLFPMDGDPDAAGYFWQLAVSTRGSFLTPSRDWP